MLEKMIHKITDNIEINRFCLTESFVVRLISHSNKNMNFKCTLLEEFLKNAKEKEPI